MLKLPVRRCPECGYVGPTRRFTDDEAAGDGAADDETANDEATGYRCPRCGHEVDPPDPRLL